MIVVVAEEVPIVIEDQAATVAQAARDDLQAAAVGTNPQDASLTRVGDAVLFRRAEKGPVSPMIGTLKISVVDERVPHRNVEIAFGTPGQRMKALVHVIPRHAP